MVVLDLRCGNELRTATATPRSVATILAMNTVPLAQARDQLSALVDEVVKTHEAITITRNGVPAAVVLSAAEYDSFIETIELLNDPVDRERLEEAEASIVEGDTATRDEVAELMRQRRAQHDAP